MNDVTQAALTALAVDDEMPNLDELAYLLGGDDRIGRVLIASDAAEALRLLREEQIDVVFLDIAMPGLSGMDLAGVVSRFQNPPAVIFVTAHAEHAVEAFDLRAVDYILKPVRVERLREAVRRLSRPAPTNTDDRIAVELGGITRLVHRDDVLFVEAEGDYSRLHTAGGSHLVRIPISGLEQRWSEAGFLRIHRSYLVSAAHLDHIRENAGKVEVMVAGRALPVSRRSAPALREQLRRTRRPE